MNILDCITRVSTENNYWLVRTQGGDYFKEFYFGNYIAIGWDELIDTTIMTEENREDLMNKAKELYPETTQSGRIASPIINFNETMRQGDIVIIPDESNKYIAFGVLSDDDIYIESRPSQEEIDDGACPFVKRRKVKWLKRQTKNEIDIYLYKVLSSHYTISNIKEEYHHIIDRTLHGFYIKDNCAHFVLRVHQNENITLPQLSRIINNNLEIISLFNKEMNEELDENAVDVKLNLNSPGPIEIFGSIGTILLIAISLNYIVGGKLKFKYDKETTECEIGTDGLIEKIGAFIEKLDTNKEKTPLEVNIKQTSEELKVEIPTFNVAEKDDE